MADHTSSARFDDGGDLFCMRCAYNLRGLAGDPRRCPECGFANPLHELLLPAAQIRRQLRRLENAPTWCIAALLLAGLGAAICVVFSGPPPKGEPIAQSIGAGLIVIGLLVWPLAARAFADSCLRREGWQRALLHFHLYAFAIFALGHVALFGTCFVPFWLYAGPHPSGLGAPGAFLFVIVVWIIAVVLIRRWYRRLRAELDPLHRDVAVRMYLAQKR